MTVLMCTPGPFPCCLVDLSRLLLLFGAGRHTSWLQVLRQTVFPSPGSARLQEVSCEKTPESQLGSVMCATAPSMSQGTSTSPGSSLVRSTHWPTSLLESQEAAKAFPFHFSAFHRGLLMCSPNFSSDSLFPLDSSVWSLFL